MFSGRCFCLLPVLSQFIGAAHLSNIFSNRPQLNAFVGHFIFHGSGGKFSHNQVPGFSHIQQQVVQAICPFYTGGGHWFYGEPYSCEISDTNIWHVPAVSKNNGCIKFIFCQLFYT